MQRRSVRGLALVDEGDHICYAEGQEVNMGSPWIHGSEPSLPRFKFMNESSLARVDTLAWAVMD